MTDARFPLETAGRLSRSVLWRLQRRFFERRGMAAWSEGIVPHHVTCNPYLARAYGQVILGFMRDWRDQLDRRSRSTSSSSAPGPAGWRSMFCASSSRCSRARRAAPRCAT